MPRGGGSSIASLALVVLAGCFSSSKRELSGTAGTTGSTSNSTGTAGGTTGGTTSSGSTSGAACAAGDVRVNGTCVPAGSACGPETVWMGDTCVAQDCASFGGFPCQLADGGLGTCQAGACVDLTSPSNCGSLGFVCPPSTYCLYGQCEYGDGGPVGCEPPRVEHYFACVLSTCSADSDNQACALPDSPVNGFCCGGVCIGGDSNNCGGCGLSCDGGSVCWFGGGLGCAPPVTCPVDGALPTACALPGGSAGTCCGAACVDLRSDSQNCALCGIACPAGGACVDGACSSACTGPGDCASGYECVLDGGDFWAPGACIPHQCSAGVDGVLCLGSDGSTGVCCGNSCVQSGTACGGQGCQVCGPGEICQYAGGCVPLDGCAASSDSQTSTPCFTDAGTVGACCGPLCVDLSSDPLNCNACGSACAAGNDCGPGCSTCGPESPCPAGYACVDGSECLRDGCDGSNAVCALGEGLGFCCGTQCVEFQTDGGDCESCGSTCPAGSVCGRDGCVLPDGGGPCGPSSSGQIAPGAVCPPGMACAGGDQQCEPILDCSAATRSPEGSCLFGPVATGACCGDRCANTELDPQNCGGCGVACTSGICAGFAQSTPIGCLPAGPSDDCSPPCGANTVCVNGVCEGSACGFDAQYFCLAADHSIGQCCANGVCAHLRDDPQNCGLCGNACPAGQTCANGACSGSPGCTPTHMLGFCNLDAGTSFACCPSAGCTDLYTDRMNCGYCGSVCPPDFACSGGRCDVPAR